VIVNTVQSAAVVADYCSKKYGREHVEHISTALIPSDREKTLKHIQLRLDTADDRDWTLFATSCVEAGVNLSFRTGFRELSSLTSLLQTAGRIDRAGVFKDSELWSFCLVEDERLKSNPSLKNAAAVLRGYLMEGEVIDPSLATKAIEKELKLYGLNSLSRRIMEKESAKAFPFVDENFRVIKSNTKLAVMGDKTAMAIASGNFSWRELQMKSMQIAEFKLKELRIPKIAKEIYHWILGYDNFIGYMRGIIDNEVFSKDALII
jgi:CRISPR-associated endonuclease/helicase Cas3